MFRLFFIFTFIFFSVFSKAQTAAALEEQARRTSDSRERMALYYKSAEKYLGANPQRASQIAHQAYSIALDLNDHNMATRAAFLNAEGFSRQSKWAEAKFRYNRSKESAENGKETDWQIRSLTKMSDMAKREGNTGEAELFSHQAKVLKGGGSGSASSNNRPNTEGGAAVATSGRSAMMPSPSTSRPTPSNQIEMNGMREQFKRQTEQLDRDRQRLVSEIGMLRKEKESLNKGMTQLRDKEKDLTEQTVQAKQTIAEKTEQLAVVEGQKQQLNKTASKKQRLLEALRNEKLLDSIAYAQDRQEQELEIQKGRNFRNILISIAGFALGLAGLAFYRFKENQKQKRLLEGKNRLIEEERQRSDELLLNILPAPIAHELKQNGKAKAQRYERASVLFTDFVDFTSVSEKLTPEQLVNELDMYFKAFDFIISQYKLEKIKTIGDAYMCASGLSDRISTPIAIVRAALEIQQFLNEMKAEKMLSGEPYFEARVGISTGPVVAGVVGVNKFAYDIWGDTVNIAARVQEACEPGRINISAETHREIQYSFRCIYRGRIAAKNKGNIDMYYVDGVNG
jgi:adenylate cyclase